MKKTKLKANFKELHSCCFQFVPGIDLTKRKSDMHFFELPVDGKLELNVKSQINLEERSNIASSAY